jgi:hypothetical protein
MLIHLVMRALGAEIKPYGGIENDEFQKLDVHKDRNLL